MIRRVLWALAVLLFIIAVLTAYVGIPAASDLFTARDILDQPLDEIGDAEGREALELLGDAHGRLSSGPADILGVLPFVGHNLHALDDAALAARPALAAGLDLIDAAESLQDAGLLADGRVDVAAIRGLEEPLGRQIDRLNNLRQTISDARSGWLVPALWNTLTDLEYRVGDLRSDAEDLRSLLASLEGLLGMRGPRTYAVLLVNNAELRGAGGILGGIGTLRVTSGRLDLGAFKSVPELRTSPVRRVPAPPDYERFVKYGANSTIFVNSTYSPDVPDDALVASRLYELVTGTSADGALLVDPRGLQALLPPTETVEGPLGVGRLKASRIPRFAYSDAYQQFEDQAERKGALLAVGQRAFELVLEEGFRGESRVRAAGKAIAGGHLKFVSFDPQEATVLAAVNASGEAPSSLDTLLVTAQNRGGSPGIGSKMDYWAEREVGHSCEIKTTTAHCITAVELRNIAPDGLVDYVTGSTRPYALLRDYLEVYVPAEAEITGFEIDDRSEGYFREELGDLVSVGAFLDVERGASRKLEVAYDLSVKEEYALTAVPQPLARDARLTLALQPPSDWIVRGPGKWEDDTFRYEADFTETFSLTAGPRRTSGLSSWWDSLADFWSEPLF
ncbi:MAG: DUF4012 domain-containing protein [Actinomycetota bacterium]|nr:DUF4012 domain-containing protein [Actinomycetota bacterium]